MTKNEAKEEIRQHAIDQLNDGVGDNVYGCDLHNELFNTDYYIVGTYEPLNGLNLMALLKP